MRNTSRIFQIGCGALIVLAIAGYFLWTGLAKWISLGAEWNQNSIPWTPIIIGVLLVVAGIKGLMQAVGMLHADQLMGLPSSISRNPVELEITLDRLDGVYHPGDAVITTIKLRSEKEISVRTLEVGLVSWEQYGIPPESGATWRSVQEIGWGNENNLETYFDQKTLVADTQLTAETSHSFRAELTIPYDAAPPYGQDVQDLVQGAIPDEIPMAGALRSLAAMGNYWLQHGWVVRVKLDQQGRRSFKRELTLPLVVPPPSEFTNEGEYGESNHPYEVELKLWLPRLEWTEGESIDGKLLVHPKVMFDACEVRLELVHSKKVHTVNLRAEREEITQVQRLSGEAHFQAGQFMEFPFKLSLPKIGMPSLYLEHATVTWNLRGLLDRSMRQDNHVDVEIMICNNTKITEI